ncbi:MAG: SRPBCC family protein [Ktedonobacteraceae bacterium]
MSRRKNTDWIRPLALAALGFGAGAIFGGGKLVRIYDWQTEWTIDAPLSTVYQVLMTPEEQDKWWPSMRVYRVTPLAGIPGGRTIEYRVQQAQSVARLVPPFKIIATTADMEKERRLRTVVTGDLVGVLETLLYSRPDGGTRIVYHWYVRVHNPVLNVLGFLFAPMFQASHDHVMKEGEAGLRRYCLEKVPVQSENKTFL